MTGDASHAAQYTGTAAVSSPRPSDALTELWARADIPKEREESHLPLAVWEV